MFFVDLLLIGDKEMFLNYRKGIVVYKLILVIYGKFVRIDLKL